MNEQHFMHDLRYALVDSPEGAPPKEHLSRQDGGIPGKQQPPHRSDESTRRPVTTSERFVLRLERTLRASQASVYRALTDPGELVKWWGPRGFTARSVEFDPKVSGRYRIAMQPPDGDPFHLAGEFREVEPPARLAYTFRWDPPHQDDRETVVSLSLKERGEKTELRLTHGDFATQERHSLHEAGWTESLERLERLLRNEPPE